MKKLLISTFGLFLANSANAAIPLLNFSCPNDIDVHADQGGPVYINGNEAKLKIFNDNYYEAKGAGVTISISINPDGSPAVSYTGKHGANGVCQAQNFDQPEQSSSSDNSGNGPPSSAIRACNAVEDRYGEVVSSSPLKPGAWEIILMYDDGRYVCNVEPDGSVTYFEKLRQ